MPDDRTVALLLTHSHDHYVIDLVGESLRRLGANPVRMDTDLPLAQSELAIEVAGSRASHQVQLGNHLIDAHRVCAVWTRQIRAPATDDRLEAQYRDGCIRNAMAARDGFFSACLKARWVNRLDAIRAASNKIHQLRMARAVGLRTPATLVTTSSSRARAFFESFRGNVVAKLLINLSSSMEHATFFVRTTDLTEEHLASLDSLRHCPMIFQERINKTRELRVVVVAGTAFIGAIDAPGFADWRLASPEQAQWSHGTLDDDTLARLRSLMEKLGLIYGAIDVIETNAGPPVFLEVNPTGEWGMLQKTLNLPIAEAIAGALMDREATT